MNKKSVTLLILKEIKNTKKELIKEKQKIYFKTFKEQNKSWYKKAINYSVMY